MKRVELQKAEELAASLAFEVDKEIIRSMIHELRLLRYGPRYVEHFAINGKSPECNICKRGATWLKRVKALEAMQ